ncbi:T-cell surface glycoprotein CD8 beta chain [Perognathus longimembris pacificus]|uniref:T-cell surface glycoprotein CD8 beta chain n=1 Tax=Perognathus longimembris pacificus TaxID=214514 RepID=UPI002018C9E9|nr:T-cell surface glycoprotein CD8 beta chain [Perognathus longimembris pacificus]
MKPWLWLVLAALCGVLASQQAPELVQVLSNESVSLDCRLKSSHSNTNTYWLKWQQAPSDGPHYEALASWKTGKVTIHSSGATKEKLTLSQEPAKSTLRLRDVTPADSGIYLCMTVGHPELTFSQSIRLNVVDALPTTIQPTRRTPRKKMCRFPNPGPQKGPTCGLIPLSLMGAGILVLLVSLGVSMRLYCLRRRARLHFMKQFHK